MRLTLLTSHGPNKQSFSTCPLFFRIVSAPTLAARVIGQFETRRPYAPQYVALGGYSYGGKLGAPSISLAVKDIETSRAFYEKFGFAVFAGDASQSRPILKNGDHAICFVAVDPDGNPILVDQHV